MMGYGGGDLTDAGCPWPVITDRAIARSLCLQAVGGGLSGLAAQFSDERAMRYTNRRLYFTFKKVKSIVSWSGASPIRWGPKRYH